ncbi:nucleoside-diphosphate sugar epimerase/dehydratase [Halomonas sp. M4R5S39]|uniref:nucleoside-diphosphate sugar epimerase/dehydratase n=1 Tax=Halomonas kalidii TaxID=3043293 RepID=UPI0024A93B6A|nr:nucleoside-diphosphate sugar epimerase/dehydratase [Halomonas kalidii]MDI5986053.1 nucleoside-diphosphate sugar epimerase/dehydratase [Halomonas kalidii]
MSWLLQRALRLSRRVKCLIQLCTDALLLSASFLVALVLKQDSLSPIFEVQNLKILLVALPISLFIFYRLGFYRALIRYMGIRALQTLATGVAFSALTLWVTARLEGDTLSVSILMIYMMLAVLASGGIRFLLRGLFYRRDPMSHRTRVVIYGAGTTGSQLVTSLKQRGEFMPVAFIDDWRGMNGTIVEGIKVYHPDRLPQVIEETHAERILLAMPSISRTRRREILASLASFNVPIQTVPGIEDIVKGHAQLNEIRDVAVEDLLGRDPVPPRRDLLDANIQGKVVMVTGAGGSIGSELCRQILRLAPQRLILLDACEYALYGIEAELKQLARGEGLPDLVEALLGSVQQRSRMESIMRTFGVQTLYHAAAYKHVPMVEYNVIEGVRNNVFGTLETARAAMAAGVETFVLVSTDKAVRPTNVMGTTKRLAELVCQALSSTQSRTRFCMVRFGNVLGSSGSVIPLFHRQISQGGPITVTDESITRYFMTIPEAATLVLQAGAMGKGGEVFVLDMGSPVQIAELARQMVRLSGLEVKDEANPRGDIEIMYTGLRPGEKLFEELLVGDNVSPTEHPRILGARESCWEWPRLEALLKHLCNAAERGDVETIRQLLVEAPAAYRPQGPIVDLIWQEIGHHPVKAPASPARSVLEPQPDSETEALLKAAALSLVKGSRY